MPHFLATHSLAEHVAAALLSLDWLAFGILHFRAPSAVALQIPRYLPCPEFLVAVSGVLELLLAVGLWTPWRPWAFLGTTLLLAAFTPAVVEICRNDQAVAMFSNILQRSNTFWRVTIVVHNVVVGVVSFALFMSARR